MIKTKVKMMDKTMKNQETLYLLLIDYVNFKLGFMLNQNFKGDLVHPLKVEVSFHVLNNLESEQIESINVIFPKKLG